MRGARTRKSGLSRPGLVLIAAVAAACTEKGQTVLTHADAGVADSAAALTRDRDDGGPRAPGDPRVTPASEDDLLLPQAASEDLTARMRHLLEAIEQNNAELATDALFPRDAYVATRDVSDPAASWEKFSGAFRRSVERAHKRTKGASRAKFVSFELGQGVAALTPKRGDFKRPLWRVKRSKIELTIDGSPRRLEIAEMTSWRGAWYVTRL